jgi:O-antigen/teichoic acid export membrane protein
MLEAFRTTTEVGYYGAGYKVYALAVAPAAALFPAFFPSLARALGRPARALAGARFAGTLLLLGLPVLAAAPFIADSLVAVLFGAAYAPSAPALKLLLVNAGVVYVAMAYGVPLTAWDRERAYFVVVALGAGLNVVLNLVLINPYGTVGAAGATLVTEAAILCGMAWLHWRTAGSLYPEAWRRALLPAATVGIAAWAVCGTWPVALWVPTLVSVWALSAAASGGLRAFRAALSPPAP